MTDITDPAGRHPGPIREAGCWSHARRRFFTTADIEENARRKAAGKGNCRRLLLRRSPVNRRLSKDVGRRAKKAIDCDGKHHVPSPCAASAVVKALTTRRWSASVNVGYDGNEMPRAAISSATGVCTDAARSA
jgi:hypothetical protein